MDDTSRKTSMKSLEETVASDAFCSCALPASMLSTACSTFWVQVVDLGRLLVDLARRELAHGRDLGELLLHSLHVLEL